MSERIFKMQLLLLIFGTYGTKIVSILDFEIAKQALFQNPIERLRFHTCTGTGTCTCSALCQLKHVNTHGDAGFVGLSTMHYMPIHTKLCVNMRITRNRSPQNRCIIEHSKVRVLNVKNTGKPIQLVISRSIYFKMTLTGFLLATNTRSRTRVISQPH